MISKQSEQIQQIEKIRLIKVRSRHKFTNCCSNIKRYAERLVTDRSVFRH